MNERGIGTVVWDADNTLWDWVTTHLRNMRVMSREISSITGVPENTVKESMKKIYGLAGTFDYRLLFEEMDIIHEWAEKISDYREVFSKVFLFNFTMKDQDKSFYLYEGVEDVLNGFQGAGIQNVIMSDAPLSFIEDRLRCFGINKYFSAVYGQPEAVSGQESIFGKSKTIWGVAGGPDPKFVELVNERKPNIDFTKKFGKTQNEIAQTVAVVGDNLGKDMGLAHNNNCLGIYAGYGMSDVESIVGLHEYGPPNVVSRNASVINSDNIRMIQQMGEKLVVAKNCREILRYVLDRK